MPAKVCHFAINADDVQRAKAFYEAVFGWTFDPWGPPDFYQIKNAGAGVLGALQGRRELKPGVRMAGYEATVGVEDLKATIAAVEAVGGRILMLSLIHILSVSRTTMSRRRTRRRRCSRASPKPLRTSPIAPGC